MKTKTCTLCGKCKTVCVCLFLFTVCCNFLTWPWPREMALNFFENFMTSANLYRSAAGSVPGDRTKMRGVDRDDSLNTTDKSDVWQRETDYKSSKSKSDVYFIINITKVTANRHVDDILVPEAQ